MVTVEEYIEYLKNGITNLDWSDDLECVIVFGSLINIPSLTRNKDIDICIVIKDRNKDILLNIREYLSEYFDKPDITVYYLDELNGRLPFRDIGNGIFALEYLATGRTIYGENIFIQLLTKASKEEFKKSILDKIFDYILRIRKAHILINSPGERIQYINKYVIRLLIDILVYFDYETLTNLQSLTNYEIISIAAKHRVIWIEDIEGNMIKNSSKFFSYNFLYDLYIQISNSIELKL